MSSDPVLLIGNLACESDFLHSIDPSCPTQEPGKSLLRKISSAATLLRVFAAEGDHLWLPDLEDARCLDPLPGLQEPLCVSGMLPDWRGPILPWGATERLARLRAGLESLSMPADAAGSVILAVRQAPVPFPAAAATANDRLALPGIREKSGCVFPGSGPVRSLQELEGRISALAGAAPDADGWIVKGRLSAAGRDRVFQEGDFSRQVRKLLRKQGALLFEPWMRRTADYGCTILIYPAGNRLVEVHRLKVTPRGSFRGIDLLSISAQVRPIDPEPFERYLSRPMAATMSRVVNGVADDLREKGYLGPAGIDFWTYQGVDGSEKLNPIGEINARMTFGLIASALSEKLGPDPHRYPDGRFRLTFPGRGGEEADPESPNLRLTIEDDLVELWVRS